ncbi:hypothetical protein [Streptomyces sp. NBC_00385]|uniref:hypothetical protein n=1 Tax=Streptomyces sp. NBC_00385 TaxID=2975733 RepID=UPI002DDA4CE3|nr:hypothetical protein [Streptomyces sp. NBC_00385]WRZ04968.1 hypothetical protein OG959_17170 [Streptomyces sp. NBC_00385]
MNDDLTELAPEPVPAPVPAPRSRARRIVLAAVPVVLVLAAVAGAATYTKITVDRADRTAGTSLWQKPVNTGGKDPAGDFARGRFSTALSKLLLPVPKDYRLGPDMGELGNDSELSGRAAAAEMKAGGRGLAGKQRRELEKRIDKLHIQGLAARSYAAEANDLVINTQLVRMKDRKAVRDMYRFQTGLFGALDVFRDGPEITGHTKNARCFRAPEDKSELDSLYCVAYDGEVLLSFSASGTEPFDTSGIALLVMDQLDHIKSPGEYV